MKALLCLQCVDIRALDPSGAAVTYRCGNVTARWKDSDRGTVRVKAASPAYARILGIHNEFLSRAFYMRAGRDADVSWREIA